MFFLLALAPFLTLISSFLVLSYTGRSSKEKITIFFFNPPDAGRSSSGTLALFRIGFWVSLLLSVGMVFGMLRQPV
jgi:hypothetical protein